MTHLVSFYTPDYVHHARNLQIQCLSLGIQHIIVPRNYGTEWIDNVRAKPTFLLEMWDYLKEPFFWLDVDSQVLKPLPKMGDEWGVLLRGDGNPHDFVHYIPNGAETFLKQWQGAINDTNGSHTAFIALQRPHVVLPSGHFKIGIAVNDSKLRYLQP